MTLRLTRLGFSNFKGIGAEPVWLDWDRKVNVLIGANNSGKSSILRALQWLSVFNWRDAQLDERDYHMRSSQNPFCLHLEGTVETADKVGLAAQQTFRYVCRLSPEPIEVVSSPYDDWNFPQLRARLLQVIRADAYHPEPRSNRELAVLKKSHALPIVTQLVKDNMPRVYTIPDIRRIEQSGSYDVSGRGIVELLASWQHPALGRDADSEKFNALQRLIRQLLHADDIQLEVSPEPEEIIVRNSQVRLGLLRDYGTGLHELIILAIAVTSQEKVLFCVEEPEIHLHPVLQSEFLDYLLRETSNHYVLTTHSQGFLRPGDEVAVQHLRSRAGVTTSRSVVATTDSLEVLADLGIRPSDLLQTNSVLWVEGPSDRAYVRRWLEIVAQEKGLLPFAEGIDYSIMFYGGRLLSHVCVTRDCSPSVEHFVELLRMGQNSAIFMDSDRGSSSHRLSATKQRIIEECEQHNVVCVVTHGREIENDVGTKPIEEAYRERYQIRNPQGLSLGRFDHLEERLSDWAGAEWRSSWSYDDDKPGWSRRVAPHITELPTGSSVRKSLRRVAQMVDDARGPSGRSENREGHL